MSCEDEEIESGEYLGTRLSKEGVLRLFKLSRDIDDVIREVLKLRNKYLCQATKGTDIPGCLKGLQTIAESLRNAVKDG